MTGVQTCALPISIAFMMVGSVVVEKIFNTPGIGPYFVDAAVNRDRFLVMGIVLLESVFLLSMNLLVDPVIGWPDPRIFYDKRFWDLCLH